MFESIVKVDLRDTPRASQTSLSSRVTRRGSEFEGFGSIIVSRYSLAPPCCTMVGLGREGGGFREAMRSQGVR